MKILVTGANGFVGRHLCDSLPQKGIHTYALLRKHSKEIKVNEQFIVEDYLTFDQWQKILKGIDAVIHTAGLAHVKERCDKDYQDINTEMTKRLALECAKAGVKRFVFISSTHVHVSSSINGILTPTSPLNPRTSYGKSKLLAEEALREVEKSSDLEVVVVRPPLVYGPHVKGNVRSLLKAIRKNIPLPFAKTQNQRSMVCVDNLVDALALCATHPKAKGKTYFISDDRALSVGELIQRLAKGMGRKAHLFYFPEILLRIPLKLLGKEETLEKITGSLQLDISDIQRDLGWKPVISASEGLKKTAHSFR